MSTPQQKGSTSENEVSFKGQMVNHHQTLIALDDYYQTVDFI